MDTEIWQKIRSGDADAMKKLYLAYYQDLFAYGFRIVSDKDKVKDCLHEMFCEIWQKRDSLAEVAQVKAYLKTWLRNKLLKEIKFNQKNEPIVDEKLNHLVEKSYEQLLIAAETDTDDKVKMWEAINQLTSTQRELIKLRFFEGLNYETISVQLQLKQRTVYNHVHNAVSALRKALKK